MDCGKDGYKKTEYVKQEDIREDIRIAAEQGIWRIRTNQELRELYKYLDIADTKKRIWEWIGHLVRMDNGGVVNI